MAELVNPRKCENCKLLQDSLLILSIHIVRPLCINCSKIVSVRETVTLLAMETLFNALTPFYPSQSTQKISNQSITRNPPFTNVDLTESILGVIKEVEQVLVKIHGDVERMIDDQNEGRLAKMVFSIWVAQSLMKNRGNYTR